MYDIVNARYLRDYIIRIEFENGRMGEVDFKEYLDKGPVFNRFRDMEYFKTFSVNSETGVLCWPDGVDIDPLILYHKATGEQLPSWAECHA